MRTPCAGEPNANVVSPMAATGAKRPLFMVGSPDGLRFIALGGMPLKCSGTRCARASDKQIPCQQLGSMYVIDNLMKNQHIPASRDLGCKIFRHPTRRSLL